MDSSGPYCKKACDASLNRMGTDHIDLCEFDIIRAQKAPSCRFLYSQKMLY